MSPDSAHRNGQLRSRWLSPPLLSLAVNLPLALFGLADGSYDAYAHIFFADHYRRWWFNLFEPRWFGGFSVASYPPLTHQLIAALSFPFSALAGLWGGAPSQIRYWGEAEAFRVLLLAVLVCFPLAAERFAAIFVPRRAARTAGWLAVGLPGVYLAAYSFGQLPTLAATVALLWALAEGYRFCTPTARRRRRHLASAVLWAGVTVALHHAVLLFAIGAGGAVALRALGQGRWRRQTLGAVALWAAGSALAGVAVTWPFIAWSRGYTPQTPIDHLSRHNYLTSWMAVYYFFLPMYGLLLLALPLMLARPKRRHAPLLGLSALLFILGLGGTTPLPALLFGSNWAWLTYDRFSLWAGIALLPLAALAVDLYRPALATPKTRPLWFAAQAGFCLFAAFAARLAHAQPPPVDLNAVADFLRGPAQRGERFLTFGFGDQMARLSVLTDAATLDGTYFTARTIPEQRQSGLGALDGALWNPAGVRAVVPVLPTAGDWGVRWAFVAHPAYESLLRQAGWEYDGLLTPGVQLWRNPGPVATGRLSPAGHMPPNPVAAAWWGLAPLTTLILAIVAARLAFL
ncbi:MAG: hypothetical protein HY679_00570 [Chloroflexi bacterium]|nr:hypothetical protein [Chloroflexota bacterium]